MSSNKFVLILLVLTLLLVNLPVVAERIPIIPQVIGLDQQETSGIESVSSAGKDTYPITGEYPVWPEGAAYDLRYVPGQVLVRFDPTGLQGQSVTTLAETINAGIGAEMVRDYGSVGLPGLELVSLPDSTSVQQAITYYQSTAGVLYAEPDFIVSAERLPDDSNLWRQYGLSNTGASYKEDAPAGTAGADIQAPGGWDTSTSTNGTIIAVVDTGVDIGHPDLNTNLWTNNQYGFPLYGYNAIDGDYVQPWDDDGHGTHCAGIIGMVGNNGIGGTGVAWNTSIMAVKALNSFGSGKVSDVVLGIAFASSNHVPIISCSIGISVPESIRPRSLEDVIRSSDSLVVCAAGNSAEDTSINPQYPACYNLDNILSVASTDANDSLSSFSNWGNRTIQVAAPGSTIFSTLPSDYSWDYTWIDPSFSPDNMTLSGNWTLMQPPEPGASPVLHGVIPGGELNATLMIETIHPVKVVDDQPDITWDWFGEMKGNMRIEYSLDGVHWTSWQDNHGIIRKNNATQYFSTFTSVAKGSDIRVRISFWPSGSDGYVDLSLANLGLGHRNNVVNPNYGYLSGTSMATPMVSGVAGLIKGANPDLTATELKSRIIETVDPLPSLKGKIVSGGRVNLTAALNPNPQVDFIPVQTGWNHVSVPRHLESGYDTASIFADIHSTGHSVLKYVDDQTGWKTLNSSDPVVPLQGYWVFSENFTTVPVRFAIPVIGPVRQVSPGWSSTGGWAVCDVSTNETLTSLGEGWSYLFGYDATSQRYDEVIIRGGSGNQSDTRPVRPYQGYWLYCNQNGTYQGPLT